MDFIRIVDTFKHTWINHLIQKLRTRICRDCRKSVVSKQISCWRLVHQSYRSHNALVAAELRFMTLKDVLKIREELRIGQKVVAFVYLRRSRIAISVYFTFGTGFALLLLQRRKHLQSEQLEKLKNSDRTLARTWITRTPTAHPVCIKWS